MEPINQNTREQLCLEIVKRIIHEAKKEASEAFKAFPKQVNTELQFSANDKLTVLTNMLNAEFINYDKVSNIKDIKKYKTDLLDFLLGSKEAYDHEMNFNKEGFDAQKRRIMFQFLALNKIEYLKKELNRISESEILPPKQEKIKWKGKPSEFGYLLNELIANGFIEPPTPIRGAKTQYKKQLAKLCYAAFSIPNLNGSGETTFDNLYEEIKKPSVSDQDTAFLKISRPNRKK